jgi:hypothetical protein
MGLATVLLSWDYTHTVTLYKVTRTRWAGHIELVREIRNLYKVLLGKLQGKKSLGRPSHIQEDNIKTDLKDVSGRIST